VIHMKNRVKIIKYAYMSLFALVCLYLLYFNLFESRVISSNSYNRRLRESSENIIRGSIQDKNGEVLVKSTKNKSGVKRKYVYPRYFSHIIGYSSTNYGSSGLEAFYNKELMSSSDTMEALRSKVNDYYVQGNNIRLTLDRSLQVYASEQLHGKKGAVVVLRPDTGEILAMVSKPDFDPSSIQNNWESLMNNRKSPLLNRAAEGLYPPGSTFKLIITSSIIKNSLQDREIECNGEVNVGGYIIKDSNGKAHGKIKLDEALKYSCNSYFIQQGLNLGNRNIYNEATKFKFNKNIQTDFKISQSVFPNKADDKNVAQESIGQGEVLMTPLHAALMVAAIANEGVMMQPYVVSSITDSKGKIIKDFKPKQTSQVMDRAAADKIKALMVEVVKSGTGTSAKVNKVTVAGKTGTAEVSGNQKSHAWFVGFAPADNPRVAIAVLIENGGGGGSTAAPIASKVLKKALSLKR
ncbi:MAG: penicillin-binding transpeptidase domain-containing protein, partial [Clostridiaceae bacterium]|nr:penicillin-binding transpeptidase domain-containing protein [Clostridiaceae bacterium]